MTAKELAAVDESAPMTIKELAVLYARAGFNGTASPFVDPSMYVLPHNLPVGLVSKVRMVNTGRPELQSCE